MFYFISEDVKHIKINTAIIVRFPPSASRKYTLHKRYVRDILDVTIGRSITFLNVQMISAEDSTT